MKKSDCDWCNEKNTFLMMACLFVLLLIVMVFFGLQQNDRFEYCKAFGFWEQNEKTELIKQQADFNQTILELQNKIAVLVYQNRKLSR